MRSVVLYALAVLPGTVAAVAFAYQFAGDLSAMRLAYAQLNGAMLQGAELRELFYREAVHSAYRMNVLRDIVGCLLGLILAAIGAHGLCGLRAIK